MTNILKTALHIIPKSKFKYRKALGHTTDEFGQRDSSYGEWVDGTGIIEPGIVASFGSRNISEKDYKDFGLDFSRHSLTLWIPDQKLCTVYQRIPPDQILYEGKIWNVIQVASWQTFNGWQRCFCQEAQNQPMDAYGPTEGNP